MALTATQIINLALSTVKAPGYVTIAQQQLNVLLADLADTQDLDLCRGIYTINLIIDNGSGNGSGPYTLPSDYKRAERDGVRYVYNGVPYILKNIDLTEYYEQVQQAGIATFPVFFATDTSNQGMIPAENPILWVWPPSSIAVPMSVQYRRRLPDIGNFDTTIPWFPHQGFLIKKLEAVMADIVDDSRADALDIKAMSMLERFMKLTNDDEGRAKRVTLDSRRFGSSYAQLPNTKLIGW